MTPAKPEHDDSDEIAAALAAVYAYCQNEDCAASSDEKGQLSNWTAAGRLEGINPGAGKIVASTQVRSKFFTWRNSLARRWTAYSILLIAVSGIFAEEALALERIQYVPLTEKAETSSPISNATPWKPALPIAPEMPGPSIQPGIQSALQPGSSSFQPASKTATPRLNSMLMAPAVAPEFRASQLQEKTAIGPALDPNDPRLAPNASRDSGSLIARGTKIRVALNSICTNAEFVLPDGAQLYDEGSHKLLADLPAQSLWQISEENSYSGKRLLLSGKTGSVSNNRVLLASGLSQYEPASYTRKFVSSVQGGFTRPPRIIDGNAKFSLPVKTIAAPAAPSEQSDLRPVSMQTGLLLNSAAKAAASSAAKPALLGGCANRRSRLEASEQGWGLIASSDGQRAERAPRSKPAAPPPVVSGYIIETEKPGSVICFAGKAYRGRIILKPRNGEDASFLVINELDLEDYLLSVLPSEMPPFWNLDALKAQSIAARSYALANLGKHASEGYDLKASTEDQVYLGVQTETEQSNRAVAATAGQVLKHNGKVVSAFFHSTSGGATETSEHVYGGKVNYLKSVPDFDDQSPHFAWNRSVPVASIEENLKKQGREIGGLLGIFPLERSQSQRITSAMLCGTLQTLIVSGEELRRLLGLPSSFFNLGITQDAYLVAGRGFGHGLGMSQWGAKFLSEQGYNAAQILSYYYKDVSVEKF